VDDAAAIAAELEQGYQAIGRYFVRFSTLILRMRLLMSWRLTHGRDRHEFGELAFAHAQAQAIADSFFAMCRYDGRFDAGEKGVANALNSAVNKVISERNTLAHGDWWAERIADSDPYSLYLVKMHPRRHDGKLADLDAWPAKKLNARSTAMLELTLDVSEFGVLALGLPIPVSNETGGGVTIMENRECRVRDVYTARAGKGSGQTAKAIRNGPLAKRVVRQPVSPRL